MALVSCALGDRELMIFSGYGRIKQEQAGQPAYRARQSHPSGICRIKRLAPNGTSTVGTRWTKDRDGTRASSPRPHWRGSKRGASFSSPAHMVTMTDRPDDRPWISSTRTSRRIQTRKMKSGPPPRHCPRRSRRIFAGCSKLAKQPRTHVSCHLRALAKEAQELIKCVQHPHVMSLRPYALPAPRAAPHPCQYPSPRLLLLRPSADPAPAHWQSTSLLLLKINWRPSRMSLRASTWVQARGESP